MRTFIQINFYEDQRVSVIQQGKRKGLRREWDGSSAARVRDFKSVARTALFNAQDGVCGYCLLPIGNDQAHRVPQIDHFAPWKKYPEWTFEPLNFVLSCPTCNEDRKADIDPLDFFGKIRPLKPYKSQKFIFVHPYIDDVSKHIDGGYQKRNLAPKPIVGLSTKGKATIGIFRLDTSDMLRLWNDEYFRYRRSQLSLDDQKRFHDIMKEFEG